MGDALFMDILQGCNIRVGSKDPKVFGRTERTESLWRVMLPGDATSCISDTRHLPQITTIVDDY